KRLQVAGAALAVGPAPSTGQDQAAKSFFEDLLRRGRLKVAKAAKSAAEVVRAAAPSTHESYTHELRREGRQMCCAGFVSTAGSITVEYRRLAPVSCAVDFGAAVRGGGEQFERAAVVGIALARAAARIAYHFSVRGRCKLCLRDDLGGRR